MQFSGRLWKLLRTSPSRPSERGMHQCRRECRREDTASLLLWPALHCRAAPPLKNHSFAYSDLILEKETVQPCSDLARCSILSPHPVEYSKYETADSGRPMSASSSPSLTKCFSFPRPESVPTSTP